MSIALRLFLKVQHHVMKLLARNPDVAKRSLGLQPTTWMLRQLEGQDAQALLRGLGAVVGDGTRLSLGIAIHNAERDLSNLTIGHECHIGKQVFLDVAAPINLGDRVTVSMRVTILTHTDVGSSRCGIPRRLAGVSIDDDAYIGAGAVIMPGIRIGAGAVVGASAVVTRDVAPACRVAGVPAKPLPAQRELNE